jgi:hypothetical protein
MNNGQINTVFLNKTISAKANTMILDSIATHYGISRAAALAEVTHDEAEHLLDYLTGSTRSVAHLYMKAAGLDGPANEKFYYVTAIDGGRAFFMAGPYDAHQDALDHVDIVRHAACDHNQNSNAGRAAFMSFGTAATTERRATSLGVL